MKDAMHRTNHYCFACDDISKTQKGFLDKVSQYISGLLERQFLSIHFSIMLLLQFKDSEEPSLKLFKNYMYDFTYNVQEKEQNIS